MTHPDHLSAAEGEPELARRVHLLINPPHDTGVGDDGPGRVLGRGGLGGGAVMKLFVWHGALSDYTDGVMFALAETAEDAKAAILSEDPYVPEQQFDQPPTVYDPANGAVGFAVWGGG